jgi:choline-sulfatase
MPRNLIYVLSDQHRFDGWSRCNPQVKTPSLERLASRGACFKNCYCNAQACVPSRASIMTGLYPEVHGLWDNQKVLASAQKTWAAHFSSHGCQTVAVGRTHHIDAGFDSVVRVPSGMSYPRNCHDPELQVHWRQDAMIQPSEVSFDDYYEAGITRTAIDFLEEMARSEKPFILYVGFLAPHAALTPPKEFWDLYEDIEFDLDEQVPPPADLQTNPMVKDMMAVSPEQHQRIARGYYAQVSMIDRCIGMLLDALEESGLSEETLFLYTSDHGEQLGHRGLYSKCYGYDSSVHVPLFLSCPGTIPEGRENDSLVEHIDLTALMCDALGVERMKCSGRSFWDVCTGNADQGPRDTVYSAWSRAQCFRNSDYKWIHRLAENGEMVDEVYDLQADPAEQHNIAASQAGRMAMASFLPELQNLSLRHFRTQVADLFPEAVQPPLIPFFTT